MHANDKGWMNGYIGNDNMEQNERRTDTGGTIYTYGDSQLPHLWHEGPTRTYQYTINQQRENSLLRVGLDVCNLPFRMVLGFQNCGLEPVTPSMGAIKVFPSEPLANAGTRCHMNWLINVYMVERIIE